ncbi:MAG: [protein-PII] uridylyltransferase [SAR86 cluster bacterium]|nr:[protein-PII] uridylyltransferase [SAR86 cluster bacterium]
MVSKLLEISNLNLPNELKEIDEGFKYWLNKSKYRKNNKIKYFLRKRSDSLDRFLCYLWKKNNLHEALNIGLFAVGGYGRRELHPFSDIDLLILSTKEIEKEIEKKIEKVIQAIWDQGFTVGHSVRTLNQAKKQSFVDLSTATNMLESRILYGQLNIQKTLEKIITSSSMWKGKKFLEAKIQEQNERHNKFDNTEYNLEPNIKSSPGGLRDIQVISWLMLKYSTRTDLKLVKPKEVLTKSERLELINSRNFIWVIRYLLHMVSGREEDRLLFGNQIILGSQLFPQISSEHEAAEKLMKKYYQSAFNISEINNTVVKSFKEKIMYKSRANFRNIHARYIEKYNLIELKDNVSIKKSSYVLLEIFLKLCKNSHLDGIGPNTLRRLKENRHLINKNFRENKRNSNLFMQILRSPRLMVTALEEMNRLGILGRYLPEFGRVMGQMQYDLFHIYTVDAHTIEVLRNMRRLFLGNSKDLYPLASSIIHELPKLEILYIAGLFHDLGKGTGKNHSLEGAKKVEEFCKKHGLNSDETALASWLVSNHLLMSTTSQKEDLSDPNIINQFAIVTGNVTKLHYLYCLTVADITATNPSLWNNWKATLLRELFYKTRDFLEGKHKNIDEKNYSELIKLEAANELIKKDVLSKNKIEHIWKNFYTSYFKDMDTSTLVWHTTELHNKLGTTSLVKVKIYPNLSKLETSQIMIYTKDRPNVFGTIVSILDKNNLQIFDAKLHETKDGNCLDSITVSDQNGNHINNDSKLINELKKQLTESLDAEKLKKQKTSKRFTNKLHNFKKNTVIEIKHDMKNRWTQIDIDTLDGPGKLMTITNILNEHKASIVRARISTLGERVEDRFCIMSAEGTPFVKQKELNKLIENLKNSLDAK